MTLTKTSPTASRRFIEYRRLRFTRMQQQVAESFIEAGYGIALGDKGAYSFVLPNQLEALK